MVSSELQKFRWTKKSRRLIMMKHLILETEKSFKQSVICGGKVGKKERIKARELKELKFI